MILIGEKLNSSIPKTLELMKKNDFAALSDMIRTQSGCGADFIDINTAMCGDAELEMLKKTAAVTAECCSCGIMLDSPDTDVLIAAARTVTGRELILNSVTMSKLTLSLAADIKALGASVVAMPVNGVNVPKTAAERIESASLLVEKLHAAGIPYEKIYVDVMVEAIASGETSAVPVLETITGIKNKLPGVKTVCGASNVSFGLPKRSALNSAFISAAVFAGLDSAILDVTSVPVMTALKSAEALAGKDEYCMEYIAFAREKLL